ncbi:MULTISPECIES: tetratricopeptide repeat protein [unclassified Thioalkalivibrio]|uniref:tetratricopeptide repeat protein n=1 Tax=unclassified Thioalkalivibrio TaxID=2621013 RepID=UPI00036E09E1|nr:MULTISPECIES: SEL1-like repeat protein [unclassified Thioalkalivibrio]
MFGIKWILGAALLLPLLVYGGAFASGDEFGRGVALYWAGEHEEAQEVLRPLAEQGHADAAFLLADIFHQGRSGVLQDYAEAARWYRRAAETGDTLAQSVLSDVYGYDMGDPIRAHMWANIATANGYEAGAEVRDYWAQQMTPEQIAEAQRRAHDCLESNYTECD